MKNIIELYHKYKEIINYLIFGVLTTIVSLCVYYGLTFTILNPDNAINLQIANVISWIAGVIFAYITNRKFVFYSKNENLFKEVSSFVGARIITLFMDMLIMFVGVTIMKRNDRIVKLIAQLIVVITNYLFSKIFIFREVKK